MERLYARGGFPYSPMASVAVPPILPHGVLCTVMELLDIKTLKAASLVNRAFNYGADRLIWRTFYICVDVDVQDVVSCDRELRRIEEGCRIACAGIRPQRIRKFTLRFNDDYEEDDYPALEFSRRILEMVFAMLRLLTGLQQLELDLAGSWDGHMDGRMSNLIRGPFPFQLERFALNKPSYEEMEFLSEFLISQQNITTLSINWPSSRPVAGLGPRLPDRRVLDPTQWHLLKNWPITHLFAASMDPDEVFDLFDSLGQSTATLQLLWFKTPSWPASEAFFRFVADPIAATVVSNLRYLVLDTFRVGNIRFLPLFSNLEELVMDLNPRTVLQEPDAIESDFFESSKSCPHLRKAVLFFRDRKSRCVIRFYRRMGAEEHWEITKEDVGKWEEEPLDRRMHRFPAMPY